MKEMKPKKDKGCRLCEKIFDCQGKDPRVKLCLQFVERRREEPRDASNNKR